ncbi:MAG: hypothetical protein AABY15_00940 [Nanoarchaeota archaeon]
MKCDYKINFILQEQGKTTIRATFYQGQFEEVLFRGEKYMRYMRKTIMGQEEYVLPNVEMRKFFNKELKRKNMVLYDPIDEQKIF